MEARRKKDMFSTMRSLASRYLEREINHRIPDDRASLAQVVVVINYMF